MANPWGAPVNVRPLVPHHCNVKVEGGRKCQNDTQHSTERGEEVLLAKKNLGSAGQRQVLQEVTVFRRVG